MHTLIDIITYSGIVQGFFIAIILVTDIEKKSKSRIFLGILLSLFSLSIIHSLFLSHRFASPLVFREPFVTLICPFLYFYVLESDRGLRISIRLIGHFVLFAIFFVFQASLGIPAIGSFTAEHGRLCSALMLSLMLFQFGFYLFRIHHVSGIHRRRIEEEFSRIDRMGLTWIRSFLLVVSVIFAVMLVSLFITVHTDYRPDYPRVIAVICAVSVYFLGFRGLRQRETSTSLIREDTEEKIETNESAPQNQEVSAELIERISSFMRERKPYLDPELTLTGMAEDLGVSRNALSFAINSGFRMNFFTLINNRRVEEVIAMFADPSRKHDGILKIAFDAGFNSKATFNHIFKKYTGFTPGEYRLRPGNTRPDV